MMHTHAHNVKGAAAEAGETPAASLCGVPFSAPFRMGVTWGDMDLLGLICPSPAGPAPAVIRLMLKARL